MADSEKSTYDLADIQNRVKAGAYLATIPALSDAFALGLDRYDIEACVLALDETDFYKTMAAHSKVGLMQDVYKPTYQGIALYVKLQIHGQAVIVSFKQDESR